MFLIESSGGDEIKTIEKISLYYFSGTGNTIYVAKQLQKRIPEIKMIPVISMLSVDEEIKPDSKTLGFCFPNHAGHLPIPIKAFIKKLKLLGDEYIFAICNSAFSKSFTSDDIDKILKKKGLKLNAYVNLMMPDNHAFVNKGYTPPDKEDLFRCEEQVQLQLNDIKEVLSSRSTYTEKDLRPAPFPPWIDKMLRPLLFFLIEKKPCLVLKGAIYADSKCTGCKTCEKVCPAERIAVRNSRPVFDCNTTCFGCYACLNFCPLEALQVGSKWYNGRSYSTRNRRYPHPYANALDIARQKTDTPI